jgi:hypothetical protein
MEKSISSISNILLSVEGLIWNNIAESNDELLICKNDYLARLDELTGKGSAVLWNIENIEMTHHWSADLIIGFTIIKDFGNRRLYKLTDDIKYLLDEYLYIPVYDYSQDVPEDCVINKLVVTGPIKWLPIITEPNEFKTSMFVTKVKYAQTSYR